MRLPLLSLCLLALGCDSLWAPYRGANSDHCAINPAICTSAQVCNSENGKCEDPSGLQLPHVKLSDCQISTLLDALNMTDSGGFELVLPPGCTYQFAAPSSYLYGPSALPPITKPIAIDGNGAVFQGAGSTTPFRFAYVAGAPPDFGSSGPGRRGLGGPAAHRWGRPAPRRGGRPSWAATAAASCSRTVTASGGSRAG